MHKFRPIFSTQFHPEAKGGPLDSSYLFDQYLDTVRKYKRNRAKMMLGSVDYQDREASWKASMPSQRQGVEPTQGMKNVARAQALAAGLPVDAQVGATAAAAA